VSSCKPSDDGKALIFRLFETAGKSATVKIDWSNAKPKSTWLSSTAEEQGSKLEGSISLPAWGVATLRAELE
jgi:alpha-mannosidase